VYYTVFTMKNQNTTTEIQDRLSALRQLRRCTMFPDWAAAERKAEAILHHQRCLALIRAGRTQPEPQQVPEHSIWETESCGRTGWAD
jgi:hypothetical protein